jgi:copper transport protein
MSSRYKPQITELFKILTFIFVALSLPTLSISSVSAHSSLEETIPRAGSLVKESPSKIDLWFKDPVILSSDSLRVTNQEGKSLQFRLSIDPIDQSHITLDFGEALPPGYYTVNISVLAPDGDALSENFQFGVEKPKIEKEEMWRLLQLEKSIPSDGTILNATPKKIELYFTQPSELTAFGLFNDKQEVVPTNEPYIDTKNNKHYLIEVSEELRPGTYTIHWYSTIEGKDKNGVIYFAVKEVTSIVAPQGISKGISIHGIGIVPLANWIAFSGMIALFGGTWFLTIIMNGQANHKRWKMVSKLFLLTSILGLLFLIIGRWFEFSQMSLQEFMTSRFLLVPIFQMVILALGLFITKNKTQLFLFGLALVLWSLTGHSSQPRYGGSIGIGIDALHLLSASIWLGGLMAFILLIPRENPLQWLKEAGKGFSKWSLISIPVIIITGIWMANRYVPSYTLSSFFTSEWGIFLGLKLVLFIVILILGYFQKRTVKRISDELVPSFFRRTKIEIGVGMVILLCASVLLTLSPTEAEQGIYPSTVKQDHIEASLEIAPFKVGINDITIRFKDAPEFKEVRVKFSMPPQWFVEQVAFPIEKHTYRLTGNFVHSAGTMYVEVHALTQGGRTLVFPFRVQVPGKMP